MSQEFLHLNHKFNILKRLSKYNMKLIMLLLVATLSTACAPTQPQIQSKPLTLAQLEQERSTVLGLGVSAKATQTVVAPNSELAEIDIPTYTKKSIPITADLWKRIRQGYQLDLSIENRRIKSQRDWYARHQQYLDRVVARGERYLYHITQAIEKHGLPMELALLPIVESAFDPFAYSHGRASGIWQFIPSTGKRFGLDQNWWYDGRRDVVASTEAALNYLEYLNKRFKGDWLLALAAYNSGEGNVHKAIRRNRSRGKPTDYWSLDLPRETKAYVPKLLGLAQLINNPQDYNINLAALSNKPFFDRFNVDSQIDLAQAATLAGISLDDLYLLNAGYNQWATPPDGPHFINIPAKHAAQFKHALANLPAEDRVNWRRYKIRKGDTLGTIAMHHKTTKTVLKQVNQLRNNNIRAGDALFIPVASKTADYYALSEAQRKQAKLNKTKTGQLKNWHTVQSGDSFWDISRQYGIGIRTLARWNGMATRDTLKVGQKLVFWTDPLKLADSTSSSTNRQIIRKINYRVRKGDSLARIANKFNISISNIEAWNNINRKKYLQPNQKLVLHVDITQASL